MCEFPIYTFDRRDTIKGSIHGTLHSFEKIYTQLPALFDRTDVIKSESYSSSRGKKRVNFEVLITAAYEALRMDNL